MNCGTASYLSASHVLLIRLDADGASDGDQHMTLGGLVVAIGIVVETHWSTWRMLQRFLRPKAAGRQILQGGVWTRRASGSR